MFQPRIPSTTVGSSILRIDIAGSARYGGSCHTVTDRDSNLSIQPKYTKRAFGFVEIEILN